MKHLINLVIVLFISFACFPVHANQDITDISVIHTKVLKEMDNILSRLRLAKYRKCDAGAANSIRFKVYKDTKAVSVAYKELQAKYSRRVKRNRLSPALANIVSRTEIVEGFTTEKRSIKAFTVYVPRIKSTKDTNNINTWAHELVHVVCGAWHDGGH